MTFSREDGRSKLSIRCSNELVERLDAFADEHGKAKSEVVRNALDSHLPSDDVTGPEDSDLRETWRWLRDRADSRGHINAQAAVSELAQSIGIKEKFVKSSRLKPLERRGWIHPNFTYIVVVEPTVDHGRLGDE